ncbi:DUF805 domain-containing protein [Candidatus Margulisiibacteriota bacterium]
MENLIIFVRELFVFEGRIGRWKFVLNWCAITIFTAVAQAIFYPSLQIILIIPMFISLVMQIANIIKRLHDMDAAWGWLLLMLVPIANVILFLFLLFQKGTFGPNKYGEDPLII